MDAAPASSIPERSDTWGQCKATYRFLANESVSTEALGKLMNQSTAANCASHQKIVLCYDTTNVAFSSSSAKDLGYLDHGGGSGLMQHSTYCSTVEGHCLGLLAPEIWARDPKDKGKAKQRRSKPIEDKESFRWPKAIKAAEDLLTDHSLIHVADREADIYEIFTAERKEGSSLLIRATHPRKISGGELLWKHLEGQRAAAVFDLPVKQKDGTTKVHTMEVRYGSFELQPPVHRKKLGAVKVRAVLVTEKGSTGAKGKLRWQLLTTLSLEDAAAAVEVVRLYSLRWNIERFHYVVKSGYGLEGLQLRTAAGLKRAMLLYSIGAIRLMQLQDGARGNPEADVEQYLSQEECRALEVLDPDKGKGKAGKRIKTVGGAVWVLGRLGGFLGRKCDGQPGIKNLWRGIKKLNAVITLLKNNPTLIAGLTCG